MNRTLTANPPKCAPVLVTGLACFVGLNLARQFVRSGRRVVNLDLLTYAGNLKSLLDLTEVASRVDN